MEIRMEIKLHPCTAREAPEKRSSLICIAAVNINLKCNSTFLRENNKRVSRSLRQMALPCRHARMAALVDV